MLILIGKFCLFFRFDRSVPYDDLGVVSQLTPRRWDHSVIKYDQFVIIVRYNVIGNFVF